MVLASLKNQLQFLQLSNHRVGVATGCHPHLAPVLLQTQQYPERWSAKLARWQGSRTLR